MGGETYTYVQLDTGPIITVKSDRTVLAAAGRPFTFGLKADTCHLFDSNHLALERLDRAAFKDLAKQKQQLAG